MPTAEELNIDNLPIAKIRQLQRYVREKAIREEVQVQKMEADAADDDESSFESDSDS